MGYLPCNGNVPCQPDHLSKKDLEDRMKEQFHFFIHFSNFSNKNVIFLKIIRTNRNCDVVLLIHLDVAKDAAFVLFCPTRYFKL